MVNCKSDLTSQLTTGNDIDSTEHYEVVPGLQAPGLVCTSCVRALGHSMQTRSWQIYQPSGGATSGAGSDDERQPTYPEPRARPTRQCSAGEPVALRGPGTDTR